MRCSPREVRELEQRGTNDEKFCARSEGSFDAQCGRSAEVLSPVLWDTDGQLLTVEECVVESRQDIIRDGTFKHVYAKPSDPLLLPTRQQTDWVNRRQALAKFSAPFTCYIMVLQGVNCRISSGGADMSIVARQVEPSWGKEILEGVCSSA